MSPIHFHHRGGSTAPAIAIEKEHVLEGNKTKPTRSSKRRIKNLKSSVLHKPRQLWTELKVSSSKVLDSDGDILLSSGTGFVHKDSPPREVASQNTNERTEFQALRSNLGLDSRHESPGEAHSRDQPRKSLQVGSYAQRLLKALVQKRYQKVVSLSICANPEKINASQTGPQVRVEQPAAQGSKLLKSVIQLFKRIYIIVSNLLKLSKRPTCWSRSFCEESDPNLVFPSDADDHLGEQTISLDDKDVHITLDNAEVMNMPETSSFALVSEGSSEFVSAPLPVSGPIGHNTLDQIDFKSLCEEGSETEDHRMSNSNVFKKVASSKECSPQSSSTVGEVQSDHSGTEDTRSLFIYPTANAITTIEEVEGFTDSVKLSDSEVATLEISAAEISETESISEIATNATNIVRQHDVQCTSGSEGTQYESAQTRDTVATSPNTGAKINETLDFVPAEKPQKEGPPNLCDNAALKIAPVEAEVESPILTTTSTTNVEEVVNVNGSSPVDSSICDQRSAPTTKSQTECASSVHANIAASQAKEEYYVQESREHVKSVSESEGSNVVLSAVSLHVGLIAVSKVSQAIGTSSEQELEDPSRETKIVSNVRTDESRSELLSGMEFVSLSVGACSWHTPADKDTSVQLASPLCGVETCDIAIPGQLEEAKFMTSRHDVLFESKTEMKQNESTPACASASSQNIERSYNPCTKTAKAWIDYDTDDDSIFEEFFAAHGKTCPSKESSGKIVSTEATIDSDAAARPADTPTQDSAEWSDLSLTKHKSTSSLGVWKRVSLHDLFSSVTPDSASPGETISKSQFCPVKASAEQVCEEVDAPVDVIAAETEPPITYHLVGGRSSEVNVGFKGNEDAFDDSITRGFDGIESGNSASTDDPAENCRRDISANNQLWMKTELLLLKFKENESELAQDVTSRFSEHQKAAGSFLDCQSQVNAMASQSIDSRENNTNCSIATELRTLYDKMHGLAMKILSEKSQEGHISEQTQRKIIIGFRRIFLHTLESIVKPCDAKVRDLIRDLLSLRRIEAQVFSLGSGVSNEIAILCEGLSENESLDCPSWRARIQICEERLKCIDTDFAKVESGLVHFKRDFDSSLKSTVDIISKIKAFTGQSLEKFYDFIECSYPENNKRTEKAVRFTQAEEFKKKSEWYFDVDLNEFEKVLSKDFISLIKAKESITIMTKKIHEDFENAKKAMDLYELSNKGRDLSDSGQPKVIAKGKPDLSCEASTDTKTREKRKKNKSKKKKSKKR